MTEFIHLGGLCNIVLFPLKAIAEKKSHSIEIVWGLLNSVQSNLNFFLLLFALER